ncbi:MAG TPA: AAA family ATPase, partial [Pilimelia sp.]|nr:AAA family ATPase [Pilimelia sp.]
MTSALLGRAHPEAVLRAEIRRATDSHGGLVLVTGEAGIGKTTLVTAGAEEARRRGALVLGGSCWDSDSAPGYWPWVQVVRALRRGASGGEWAAAQDAAGAGLAILLGEFAGGEPGDAFRLYDAVTTALVAVSQQRPVVVILDDLHWADVASLKLLEFAAQHTWFERLLLMGTYRDVEVESAEHPLRPLMTPLVAKATTVTLTGLEPAEVATLMRRTAGRQPDAELVAEVHRRTGGNPFFVEQTARLWSAGGPVNAVAPGVRDALQRRLSQLPRPVFELLTGAAVLGREFHGTVLAATAPDVAVDRLLDRAVAARLVADHGEGGFSFTHDLVREALYDSLPDADVRRRHAAVVRALDAAPTLAEWVHPAEVARHAYLAGAEVEPTHAVERMLAAAADAAGRMAFEESIGHNRRALERAAGCPPRKQAVIALSLGHQLHHAGSADDAWQAFTHALGLARGTDDPDLLTRVALTLYQTGFRGDRGQLAAELIAEAHRTVVGGAQPHRAGRSVDRLATELTTRLAMLARDGDDDEALSFSLWALHDVSWGLGSAAERLALMDELIAVARRTGESEKEHFATSLRWVALLELGDPAYLDQFHAFVAMTAAGGPPRSAFSGLLDRSIVAGLCGRFPEAQALLDEAQVTFGGHDHAAFAFMDHQLRWAWLQLQGRFEELHELQEVLVASGHPYPQLLAGISAVQRGDIEAARDLLAQLDLGDDPFARSFTPLALRLQAQVGAATRDRDLCTRARAALAPYRGQWVVSLYGCDISGPVDLWVAVIDSAERRWAEAIAGFTRAYRSADRLQARPWSIEARAHLGRTLRERAAEGDAAEAAALLERVRAEATEIGMRHVVDRVDELAAGDARRGGRAQPPGGPPAAGTFRRAGAVWLVEFGGRTAHVPDAKGLRDLHVLLGRPGTDVAAG